jgi:hypothetical protein
MSAYAIIAGVPFLPLDHHDGGRIRGGGLFVFVRRSGPRRVILHMELAEAIDRRARPGHPRWDWAITNGLNELLICLASAPLQVSDDDADVVWHEDAEFWPSAEAAYWPEPLEMTVARLAEHA